MCKNWWTDLMTLSYKIIWPYGVKCRMTCLSAQGDALWGWSRCDCPSFRGKIPQQSSIWVMNRHFQAKLWTVAYYRNYCIDADQILHSDKYHEIHVASGPAMHITNPIWPTATILKTTIKKSSYLSSGLTDQHETLQCDAYWPFESSIQL